MTGSIEKKKILPQQPRRSQTKPSVLGVWAPTPPVAKPDRAGKARWEPGMHRSRGDRRREGVIQSS